MTTSDLKPIGFILYILIGACFITYYFAETAYTRNFAIFFLFVSIILLSMCFIFCKTGKIKIKEPQNVPNLDCAVNEILHVSTAFSIGARGNLSIVGNDLEQIKKILRTAISGLLENFYEISSLIDHQQRLTDLLDDSTQESHRQYLKMQVKVLNQKIKEVSGNCVRSLQFEDIATQLVDHGSLYISELENQLEQLQSIIGDINSTLPENVNLSPFEKHLLSKNEESRHSESSKRSNITQESVSISSVDIFH